MVNKKVKIDARQVFYRCLVPLLLLFWLLPVQAQTCVPTGSVTEARVERVIDADTLVLQGGERVRLLGIDAPELGYRGQADEPFAREGTQWLRALLASVDNRVLVQTDEQVRDRHQRLLAWLYLPDQRSIQQLLLEQGFAMQVFVAPNFALSDCLRSAEQRARTEGKGIWSLPEYAQGMASDAIAADARGAMIVRGRVERVGQSRDNLWLNLSGRVAVQIRRADLHRFDLDPARLQGEEIRVRGWLVRESSRHHDYRLRVEDGRALERLP